MDIFGSTLEEPAIRRSFLYNQTDEDIFERSRIYGMLLETISGLQSVQFVDTNGIRIHYSTSPNDIIIQGTDSTSYRNYTEDTLALGYDMISVPVNGNGKFTMDEQSDRIIYSFPFIDSMDVYRGTAVFSVAIRSLSEKLIAEGRLKVSDGIFVIQSPSGILFGSPGTNKVEIFNNVSRVWNNNIQDRVILDADDSGVKYSLISFKTDKGIFFGRLVNDTLFNISDSMKYILYISMFLTLYLALFFLINLKPHAVTIVQSRLSQLRDNLLDQFYDNKDTKDKAKWILELEQRRDEVRLGLKNNLRMSRHTEKDVDRVIDLAWDELLAIVKINNTDSPEPELMETKTKLLEPRFLDERDNIEETQALDDLEEVETIDELDELGEAEVIEEVEALEEFDEPEEAEVIEEVEALEEFDEPEEVEVIEEVEALEEFDEPEEVEVIDEANVYEDPDELGEIEDLDEELEDDEMETFEELVETEEEKTIIDIDYLNKIEIVDDVTKEEKLLVDIDYLNKIEIVDEIEYVFTEEKVLVDTDYLDKIEIVDDVTTIDAPELTAPSATVVSAKKEQKPSTKKEPKRTSKSKTSAKKTGSDTSKKRKTSTEKEKPAAIPIIEPLVRTGRGLLALASEFEFNRTNVNEINNNDERTDEENISNLDIVSPFSSMFSSLNNQTKVKTDD
jgi:hypothetical protein